MTLEICTPNATRSPALPFSYENLGFAVVLVVQLVSRHSCVADRLPVVVRFPAGPRVRLKPVDPPGQKEIRTLVSLSGSGPMEQAAIHRMATSITQLTLCQVSMEEIQASAELLEKPAAS